MATVLPLRGENWGGFHRRLSAFQCGLNSLQMIMYHLYNQEQYNKSSFHSKKSGFNEAQSMQSTLKALGAPGGGTDLPGARRMRTRHLETRRREGGRREDHTERPVRRTETQELDLEGDQGKRIQIKRAKNRCKVVRDDLGIRPLHVTHGHKKKPHLWGAMMKTELQRI